MGHDLKERCIQQMLDHVAEYPNPTAAADAIGMRNSVGAETVRRSYEQALTDRGECPGAKSEELAQIKELATRTDSGSPLRVRSWCD